MINVLKFKQFLFLFSINSWLSRLEFTNACQNINRGDPDQTQKQSDMSLHCLSTPFWQALVFEILEYLPFLSKLEEHGPFQTHTQTFKLLFEYNATLEDKF